VTDAFAAATGALRIAADSLGQVADHPPEGLAAAMQLVLDADGRVAVTGIGKSGLVAAKIAATLSSTGTPAAFVHAGDALHGDAGVVRAGDVLIAISNSGTSAEVCAFAELARESGASVIAISGCDGASRLAGCADLVVDAGVTRECDPHDLVPSASTTVALALGDALAIGLMAARGFGPADFGRFHPGGALGERTSS
jgi:arabinose-5-phosphate isomerase